VKALGVLAVRYGNTFCQPCMKMLKPTTRRITASSSSCAAARDDRSPQRFYFCSLDATDLAPPGGHCGGA
jgi:hypothetical protein